MMTHDEKVITHLDALSRTRALTEAESMQLEFAIRRHDEGKRIRGLRAQMRAA